VLIVVASAVALVLVASGLGYRWLTSSRPVSAQAAVTQYRSGQPALAAATSAPRSASAPTHATPTAMPTKSTSVVPSKADPLAWWHAPRPGVYTYRTVGYEEATFSRDYPPESQRIIDTSDGAYKNHHIFSQEHEEWYALRPTARGAEMLYRRLHITFGPLTVDDTVTLKPPLLAVAVPYQLGRTWKGSWSGITSGTYTAKTIAHRTIRIGDEDVDVWVNQLKLTTHGEYEGTVDVKLWYAPRLGTTAREDGVYEIRPSDMPVTYHSKYTITLESTDPHR
jgi:hypothetical protein